MSEPVSEGNAAPYILRCQEDSHLQSLEQVEVLVCAKLSEWDLTQLEGGEAGKKKKGKKKSQSESDEQAAVKPQFKIQLANTILFPQGGGQPCDFGDLELLEEGRKVHVVAVERAPEGTTWHYTAEAIEPGSKVNVYVDWDRRQDHMQCHSGQHLITAVALKTLKYPTVGWSLTSGQEPCYLDLAGEVMSMEILEQLEKDVNAEIMASRSYAPRVYTPEEFKQLDDVRFKDLPDSRFPVRVVEIDGLDVNACCGTHVKSSAELQVAKILRFENAGPGVFRVYFVVGKRAIHLFSKLYDVSKGLTEKLSCGVESHEERVDALVNAQKANTKSIKSLQKDLAELLGPHLVQSAQSAGEKAIVCHRRDVTAEFPELLLKAITAHVDTQDFVVLISIGDETTKGGGSGAYLLAGQDESLLKSVNDGLVTLLDAKGGGKGKKYQGKILQGGLTVKQLAAAQKFVKETVENNLQT